jgi:GT2 family glycosyltransferase
MHEHQIVPGVQGWLESPASDVIASDCLAVCGWAFVSDARIVDVWSTGFGARRPLQCGIERGDVARLYPGEPNALNSGFTGYLELEGAPGERVNFDIWARLGDGRTIRLFQRALTTRAPGYDVSHMRSAIRQLLRHPGVMLSPKSWRNAFGVLKRTLSPLPAPKPQSATGKALLRRATRAALADFLKSRSELTFFPSPAPTVSIVLVVWNHADLTLTCLQALAEQREVATELIVVDNASTDETADLLSRIKGAMLIRNESNLGFTVALNTGGNAACGEFLMFVNNDAAVVPGTIGQLLQTARRSNSIGAVGGKLVYPDGRLQEAGSIIWSDGSCESYGRGGDPDAPEYNFERPVDFCSAALLLTRRTVFEELGGFDERYRPAYYDDADYCVRVWRAGHAVMYQPKAAAIHYEFGSTSPEASRELQLARRPIFVEAHHDWLASQSSADDRDVQAARVHPHGRPSVIVIDDARPDPRMGSGFPRAAALLDSLADLGYLVTLYVTNQGTEARGRAPLDLPGVEVVAEGPSGLRHFLTTRNHHDLVIVSRPHNMQYVKGAVGSDLSVLGVPCVYDAEAIYALREIGRRRLASTAMSDTDAQTSIDAELRLARGCAAVLAVNEVERKRFEAAGVKNVFVAGHAVEPRPTPAPWERRKSILFVGAFSSQSPNEDAVTFFCREVLPQLRARGCGGPLVVVGANLPDHLGARLSQRTEAAVPATPLGIEERGASVRLKPDTAYDGDVSWHANVDDLTPFYDDARVFVAPTRYSAGISLKVIEAAAHGVPVVCTPAVGEQLGWKSGDELLTAENSSEFAAAVASLYSNAELWRRLRETALARVSRDYSAAAFCSAVQSALAPLSAGRSPGL